MDDILQGVKEYDHLTVKMIFEECRQIAEEGKPYEYMDNELAENYKEWIKS